MNEQSLKWGFIHVITGDGKGKTSSSIGTALRALAAGRRVAIIFFDKGGTHYMEREFFDWLASKKYPSGGRLEYFAFGLDRIDSANSRFRFGVLEEDKIEGRKGMELAKQNTSSGEYDLVILDEINSCVNLGIIDEKDALNLLDNKSAKTEIICTGRNAPKSFIEKADLASEVFLQKHYFYKGIKARAGIDY